MEQLSERYQNTRPPMQEMFELQRQRLKEQGYREEKVTMSYLRYVLSFFFSGIITSLVLGIGYKVIFGLRTVLYSGSFSDFVIMLLLDAIILVAICVIVSLICSVKFNQMGSKSLYFVSSWKLGPYIYNAEPLTLRHYRITALWLIIALSLIPLALLVIFKTFLTVLLFYIAVSFSVCISYYLIKTRKVSDLLILQVPNTLSILAFRK